MKLILLTAAILPLLQATAAWSITFCKESDDCTGDDCHTIEGDSTDCVETGVQDAKSFITDMQGCTELAVYSDTVCDHNSINMSYDDITVNKYCMAGTEYVTNSFSFLC